MDIIITDVTNMNGRRVCIAGVDRETRACIRPQLNANPSYISYEDAKQVNLQPGSIVRGNFSPVPGRSLPHIEDHHFDKLSVVGRATSEEFQQVLEATSVRTFAEAFGRPLQGKSFPATGTPPQRSIVTVKLNNPKVQLRIHESFGKLKADITDSSGHRLHSLPLKDRRLADHSSQILGNDPGARRVKEFYENQPVVYVRLGLPRAWAPEGAAPAYWIQLNGIYSFPDYLPELNDYV